MCAALLDRVTRWNEGKIDELWSEARKLYPGGDRPSKPSSLANNIRRATECAQDARYGKAVAALLSLGTCPMNADTLKEMQAKHPEAGVPTLPSGPVPEAVRFDVDLVRKKVEGFPTGSAAGASGTRPQFLKDILSCSNKAVADTALATLTRLTNHMVAGLAPRELAPFIAGAPLMALVKQGGGYVQSPLEKPFAGWSRSAAVKLPQRMPRSTSGLFKSECLLKVGLRRQCTQRGG